MAPANNNNLVAGMKLPLFKRKGHPSPISVADLNVIVRVLNALLNPRVVSGQGNRVDIANDIWQLTLDNTGASGAAPAPTSSGMNYRGTYDDNSAYSVGDVVRVKSGSAGTMGVWICVQNVSATGPVPQWPEPNDVDPAASNTWELLSLSPKTFQGCAGGLDHTYYISLLDIP